MHVTPVYFIPELAPIAQVIAMPMHRRPRHHARAIAGEAEIIPLPRIRFGSYPSAKREVSRFCRGKGLSKDQLDECLGRVASEVRRGRCASVAINAGISLAKLFIEQNNRHGDDCA